jgi:hypothetical protein
MIRTFPQQAEGVSSMHVSKHALVASGAIIGMALALAACGATAHQPSELLPARRQGR